ASRSSASSAAPKARPSWACCRQANGGSSNGPKSRPCATRPPKRAAGRPRRKGKNRAEKTCIFPHFLYKIHLSEQKESSIINVYGIVDGFYMKAVSALSI